MVCIASCHSHCPQRQGFPTGGAGTVDSKQRNAVSRNPERSGNALPQQIPGKQIRHILRFPAGLFHGHVDRIFLEVALRLLPGLAAEKVILSHHIKQSTQRPFALFFSYDTGTCDHTHRLCQPDTASSHSLIHNFSFHAITLHSFLSVFPH